MSNKASTTTAPGWVVEVFGDGIGARHRRYIVGATDRDAAIKIVRDKLGPDLAITATSEVKATAFGAVKVEPGEIIPM
jgi:hypothetical protein